MTDLERFFRQVVRNLAATDAARLYRPITLAEIRDFIVPYRSNRRALQLESSEDYELVLMQLFAGEGGLAKAEPEEVRAILAAELRSSNPDLEVVHQHENAVITLESQPLAAALSPEPGLAFAPPDHVTDLELVSSEVRNGPPTQDPNSDHFISHCTECGGLLPSGRGVNFCPYCGGPHRVSRCPACRSEIEAGWRHCVSCGAEVSGN